MGQIWEASSNPYLQFFGQELTKRAYSYFHLWEKKLSQFSLVLIKMSP